MAIDSRNKRESVLQVASHTVNAFPNPDSSLANEADRQHVAKYYSGISTGGGGGGISSLTVFESTIFASAVVK